MKKMILLISLIFLLFSGTLSVYAYTEQNNDMFLNDTESFVRIDQKVATNGKSVLIPTGAIRRENDVYELTFEYEIHLSSGLELDMTYNQLDISSKSISGNDLDSLFNFDYEVEYIYNTNVNSGFFENDIIGTKALVTVSISMNEPSDYEQYLSLAGATLSYNLVFTAK